MWNVFFVSHRCIYADVSFDETWSGELHTWTVLGFWDGSMTSKLGLTSQHFRPAQPVPCSFWLSFIKWKTHIDSVQLLISETDDLDLDYLQSEGGGTTSLWNRLVWGTSRTSQLQLQRPERTPLCKSGTQFYEDKEQIRGNPNCRLETRKLALKQMYIIQSCDQPIVFIF